MAESEVEGRGRPAAFPSPEPLRVERVAGPGLGGGLGVSRLPAAQLASPSPSIRLCHCLELDLSVPPFPFLETGILPILYICLENSRYRV